MKEKVTIRHAAAMHLRGMKELHKASPQFFPVLTFCSIFGAITPYVTVFFSARILKELAGLRREDVLWKWVIGTVLCIAVTAIVKAVFQRRYNSLVNDLWDRKEILFARKMFAMDFSELEKQEIRDLLAQIKQNENWSGWGFMKIRVAYGGALTNVIGLLSGIALTVELFTSQVPDSAGWLTVLNNPVFVLVFAVLMIGTSVLAGKLSAIASKLHSGYAKEATFSNRLVMHFGLIGFKKERSMDVRMNNQQNLISAYWAGDNVFGADGLFSKASRGKKGIYASLGVCIATLITGFIYVFTCLKAWGGAFDVGSITQYVGAATAMATNVFGITDWIGILQANTPFLENTFKFLDIPNAMYQGSLTTEKRSDRQIGRAHV